MRETMVAIAHKMTLILPIDTQEVYKSDFQYL